MGKGNIGFRRQILHTEGFFPNGFHPIIEIKDLSATAQFPVNSFSNEFGVVFHDISLDGTAFLGWFLQNTHITNACQRHMQCSGDRRCCQCENVHIFPQTFQFFLMCHPKTLFLVHNDQTQILELHIFGQDAMGTDDNIGKAFFQSVQTFLLLFGCTETGQQFNFHRIARHTLDKGIVMLLCQNGGRHQICHLFSILHGFECGTDSNFRFAIANVPADQSVHDFAAFHIFFHIFDGVQLVICFIKGEGFFKFPLPQGICPVHMTLCRRTFGIKGNQVLRQYLHGSSGFCLCFQPILSPQFVQSGCSTAGTNIFLNHIHLADRHKKIAPIPIGNFHIIFLDALHGDFLQSPEHADAVVIVYHIVPDMQVGKTLDGNAVFLLFLLPLLAALAENLTVGKDSQTDIVILEPFGQRAFGHPNTAGHHFFFQIIHINSRHIHFRQFRRHPLGTGTCPCQHQNPVILFFQILQFLTEQVCPFLERRNGTYRKICLCFGLEVRCPLGNPCQ